jgi:hypothetical protein
MMRRVVLVTIAVLSLGFASIAAAHKLSSDAAKRKAEPVSKRLCEADPDCVKYEVRYCNPVTNHKVPCEASYVARRPDGERQVCRTKVTIVLKPGSKRPRVGNVGETRCT